MESHSRSALPSVLVLLLLLLLIAVAAATLYVWHTNPGTPASVSPPSPQETYLAVDAAPRKKGFDPAEIPAWLFVHVGIIAGFQLLSVIAAGVKSMRWRLRRADIRTITFLCEIPMYLGLFGTLLGVCLTQFLAGSLVAPLAYLTTMSGIVLHVAGKLFILLPLPEQAELEL